MENLFESSKCLTKDQMKGYLQKQMNKEKQIEVERHLVDCALCSDAIDGYTNHYNFESDETFENLDGFLKEKEQMMMKKTVKLEPRKTASFNRIAASILLFLIPISGFLYWNSNSSDRIFDDLHTSAENSNPISRSELSDEPYNEMIATAETFYKQKDFESSAHLYSEYLKKNPENPKANFFAGASFLEINQIDKAIEQLTIARMNSAAFYEEATWLLILANLKNKDADEVKALASDLLNLKDGTRYREKVNAVLKELE